VSKYIFSTGFIFLFIIINICAAKTLLSNPTETPIVIDGKDNDWNDSLIYYVEELDGVAGIVNDDSSLIIMFRFGDPELRRKIRIGGATLWWHSAGKKKKEFGIRFPAQFKPGSFREMIDLRDYPDRNMDTAPFPMELISPVFWDKKKDKKYTWSEIIGIAASAGMVNGMFCYEFRIPLNVNNPYALNIKPGKKFKLCFELGGLENRKELLKQMGANERPRNMGGRGDGMGGPGGGMSRPGGMGGRGGGMRPNGSRMGDRQNMKDMFKAEDIWISIKLNDKR